MNRKSIVKNFQIGVGLFAGLAVGLLYAWSRISSEVGVPAASPVAEPTATAPVLIEPAVGDASALLAAQHHRATEQMIASSTKAAGTTAPEFEAPANDGQTYRLAEMVAKGPVVLIFIKDGCPCSRTADTFLQRLHSAGRGWVPFYGVIDGGVTVAERWAEETQTVFPILADPDRKIIHTYGAENSAYVAFIGPDGAIEKLWAGYSETMLRELAERMKPWVKPGLEPFDVSDAPAELYSGCPY